MTRRPVPGFADLHVADLHLGELLTALADGELGHDARDRALSHVAECPHCLAALDAERRMKARLIDAPPPGVPPELTVRLLSVAGDIPLPETPRERLLRRSLSARSAGRGGARTPRSSPGRADRGDAQRADSTDPSSAGPGRRARRRRMGSLAGGVLTVSALAVGSVVLLSAPQAGSDVRAPWAELGPAQPTPGATPTTPDASREPAQPRPAPTRLAPLRPAGSFGLLVRPLDLRPQRNLLSPTVRVRSQPTAPANPGAPPTVSR